MLRALHILGQMDHNLFSQPAVATSSTDSHPSTSVQRKNRPARHASSISHLRSSQDQYQDQGSFSNPSIASSSKSYNMNPETPSRRGRETRKVESTSSDLPPTPDSLPRTSSRKRKIPIVEVTDDLEPHGPLTPRTSPKRADPVPGVSEEKARPRPSGRKARSVVTTTTTTTTTEEGIVQPIGKIHLIQERVRHDPWRMLVATSLLNVTSGRAARPIYEELLRRWPTSHTLANADITELTELLYPIGLFNQRAASLVRFSKQYIDLGWPLSVSTTDIQAPRSPAEPIPPLSTEQRPPLMAETIPPLATDLSPQIPTELDVRVFHGAGLYASDSFRIFSDLFPGKGGPERERRWLEKLERAIKRMKEYKVKGVDKDKDKVFSTDGGMEGKSEENRDGVTGESAGMGVEEVSQWLSDEEGDDSFEEWRTVRPKDKELRRYLIWRWGIEGIVYDIFKGPAIVLDRDRQRLKGLLGVDVDK